MKKFLSCIMATFMALSISVPVMAAENISVFVNNKKVSFDVPPQTINGRTMVPMRTIFEKLGATVTYFPEEQAIVAEQNDSIMVILLNKEIAGLYDKDTSDLIKTIKMDTPATVINGRTLVPIRAISDGFGYNVNWNSQTKTISITSSGVTDTVNKNNTSVASKRIIGAPNVLYASCPNSSLFSYVKFGLERNSVDGITLKWIGQNLTGKTINYYTANISTYDRVGGKAYDEITNKSSFRVKYVGPVAPNDAMVINQLFTYSPTCYKATIESFDVEYSDGTSEHIEYWYSATH